MTKAKIEFKKQREIGEIITDTFAFIRQEFKNYFGTIIKMVGPYLLIAIAGIGCYLYSLGSLVNIQMLESNFSETDLIFLIIGVIFLLVGGIATYALSYSVTLNYIKSYENNNGVVIQEEIRKGVRDSFWGIIGLGVLVFIMMSVGIMLCCFPGIYLWVPLTLSFSLLVFRNLSVTDAISDSFSLIKNEWWMTFITMFVVWLIMAIASYAFSMPAIIYSWVKMGISAGEGDFANGDFFIKDPVYIALNLVSYFFQYFLNLVTLITSVLIYFNLNEKKNFTGTFEKIDSLGSNS
ncbi:hypothetical protein [Ascidiimonas sp. W6]|uniref:hypothetical protein n=1 Tax=Ascidiimonas meishanensis TaxID=3128903 RepID=UPI0030EF4C9A